MGRVVGPIYKMEENDINRLTKTVFFMLWSFVQYRLGHFDMFVQDEKQQESEERYSYEDDDGLR